MANQDRKGRNVAMPDENQPTWRPQDEQSRNRRNMSEDDRHRDRDWASNRYSDRDDDSRSIEHYGQGQSGYGSGRMENDRSWGSRNQANMTDWDQSRDRGGDDRFSGGRGGPMWSPSDRNNHMQGSRGNYGNPGHWTDDTGGGYLGQSGQQMGYGNQRPPQQQRMMGEPRYGHSGQHGSGGWPSYGGAPGQGFGQQGYGGFGPSGYGNGMSEQGMSGYGYKPEHEMGFRGGDHGEPDRRIHEQRNFDQRRFDQRMSGDSTGYGSRWGQSGYGGGHRGKGPAGYTRSDDRIREMVCDVLTDHDDIDASNIEIAVKNGEVTLSGSVEDRRTKRMAEDVIDNLSGVKEVVNQLKVSDKRTTGSTDKHGGSAIEHSPREQGIQSGSNGSEKRHRA